LPLLSNPDEPWRDAFLLEHAYPDINAGVTEAIPPFCGVRTTRYKYIDYVDGEKELYDLAIDPYELRNQAGNPSYGAVREGLASQLALMCSPPPPQGP